MLNCAIGFVTEDRTVQKTCESIAVIYCGDVSHPKHGLFKQAGCNCIDKSNKTVAFVHHGGSTDHFWSILVEGAQRAALDLGIALDVLATSVSCFYRNLRIFDFSY